MKPVVIDFETDGIEGRPSYPPVPRGVSIKMPGKRPRYLAWGHPTKNNCSYSAAHEELRRAWGYGIDNGGLLFQNGKFDLDVGETHMGLPLPAWDKVHDTLFLLFLDDPHQAELSLKPSAERLLGMAPEEQDAVADWLIEHQPVEGAKISRSKSSEHYFGRYICKAPGDVVGRYANGDTDRTDRLFDLLIKKTLKRKMGEAYDRERRLSLILLGMERKGVPVDLKRLRRDVDHYNHWRGKVDTWILKRLKAGPDLNLDSGEQLVNAMVKAGRADPDLIPRTKQVGKDGQFKFQHNKEALLAGVTDKVLLAVLKYRTQLNTCMNTFMQPWLETAEKSSGLIYTTWNQTKNPDGRGTRTGRLSSTPNFQNIPLEFTPIFRDPRDPATKHLPKCPLEGLPPLPDVRSYVVPGRGRRLADRDYSQQEPRILAHFDGGGLMETYRKDPWIDFHDYAKERLALAGRIYTRKQVKNTNLGLIYGMGVGLLAERTALAVEEAAALKAAVLDLYPGLKDMYADMKVRAREGRPIRTWGGREIYCEPAKIVDGRIKKFDYKLVNLLIQGSAADCTKQAIINFDEAKDDSWDLLLNVHDQLTASSPDRELDDCMACLKESMEKVEFDVPMLSEGKWSAENWAALKPYDVKGQMVAKAA